MCVCVFVCFEIWIRIYMCFEIWIRIYIYIYIYLHNPISNLYICVFWVFKIADLNDCIDRSRRSFDSNSKAQRCKVKSEKSVYEKSQDVWKLKVSKIWKICKIWRTEVWKIDIFLKFSDYRPDSRIIGMIQCFSK